MRPHCRGTIHYGCRVFDGEEDITTALAVSTTSAPVVVTLGDTVAVVAFPVDANAAASLHVAENGAQVRSHLRGTTTICFPPNVPRRTRYTSHISFQRHPRHVNSHWSPSSTQTCVVLASASCSLPLDIEDLFQLVCGDQRR